MTSTAKLPLSIKSPLKRYGLDVEGIPFVWKIFNRS